MTGPVSDPPPPGPGKEKGPLDPNSPRGRAAAERLARTLDEIEQEIAEDQRAAGRSGRAA